VLAVYFLPTKEAACGPEGGVHLKGEITLEFPPVLFLLLGALRGYPPLLLAVGNPWGSVGAIETLLAKAQSPVYLLLVIEMLR